MGCCDSKNQQCEAKDDLTRMKYAQKKAQNKIDRCKLAPERLGLSIHEKMGLHPQAEAKVICTQENGHDIRENHKSKALQGPAAPQLLLEEERPSLRTNSQSNSRHQSSHNTNSNEGLNNIE